MQPRQVDPKFSRPRSTSTYVDLIRAVTESQQQKRSKRFKIISLALVIAAVVLSLGIWQGSEYLAARAIQAKVPARVRDQADFTLYVPALPDYRLSSFSYSVGVVTFVAERGADRWVITEQQKPASYNFANIAQRQGIVGTQEVTTPHGPGVTGKVFEKDIGIVVAENRTLLTVTTTTKTPGDRLLALLNDFIPIKAQ